LSKVEKIVGKSLKKVHGFLKNFGTKEAGRKTGLVELFFKYG